MKGKIKFALAALLGFAAACSSVKTAPREGRDAKRTVSGGEVDTTRVPVHRIVVMYGVRRPDPQQSRQRMERMEEQDSITPVLERPVDDMPETPAPEK